MTDHEDLSRLPIEDAEGGEPLLRFLHKVIRLSVKALAVIMTLVILWAIGDVIWVMGADSKIA